MRKKAFTPLEINRAKRIYKANKSLTGFTIIEILVVIVIIGILAAVSFPGYKSAKENLALQRSAYQLAQDLKRVQEMAMSAEEVNGVIPERGYGLYLEDTPIPEPSTYVIFTNEGGTSDYYEKNLDTVVETISLEEGVMICDLSPSAEVSIVFLSPDPETLFVNEDGSEPSATIEICLESDETKTKTIKVNKAGLIYVEKESIL